MYHLFYLASTYGSGNYDTGTYNGATTATSGGGLTDTGIALAAIVTIACVILLIALVVRIWKRPKRTTNTAS